MKSLMSFVGGICFAAAGMISYVKRNAAKEDDWAERQDQLILKLVEVAKTYAPQEVFEDLKTDAQFHIIATEAEFGPYKRDEEDS